MPHRVYKFVHLQLLNVKYKCVHLQLFDVKFLFSEKHVFRKQKKRAVYGCVSFVPDFKLTRKNDDVLSSRNRYVFEVLKFYILKFGFPAKGIKLTRFVLFEVLGVPQLWATLVYTKTVGTAQKKKETIRQEILVCLIKLVMLCIGSRHRVFPFSCFPLEGFRQRGRKDSERPLLREDESIQRDFYYEQFPARCFCIRK